MPLPPGERLGPYEIMDPIGVGGMGEVYSARDTRLGRTVAIKISQERFSDRFEREARTISTLNHPNICQLYDVGPNYLVMELVDGAPVAVVQAPRKLLDLAVQMADGLAAAHAANIVHRDLKPDNILVTHDGRVKILDFGIATERRVVGVEHATVTAAGTAPGTILGTVNYMSPEQVRGEQSLGPQSDQFSLGLVLYELAGGRRAFQRDTAAETMTAIIREDPDALPATVPAPLRWVIERLLAKDPADRYDSTRDLYRDLRQMRDRSPEATSVSVAAAPAERARSGRGAPALAILATAVAGILLGGAGVWMWRAFSPMPAASSPDLSTFTFSPIATDAVPENQPSWAPDGKSIVYLASVNGVPQVFTRSIGSSETAQITQGDTGVFNPSWSTDGSLIYFNSAGALWAVGSAGGAPDRVFERAGQYVLHPDGGTILFMRGGALFVGARGKEPGEFPLAREIASLPGARRVFGFSPDGSQLAILAGEAIWIVPYPAGAARRVGIAHVQNASWMPDSRRLVLTRIPGPEAHTLSMLDTVTGDHRVFYVSPEAFTSAVVSRDGSHLAYVGGRLQWNVVEVGVADGRVRTLQASEGLSLSPAWSPSGTRYLFATFRRGRWGIEEASVAERFSRRLIETEGDVGFPQWAPDGSHFTFVLGPGPTQKLMLANSSGGMSPLDSSTADSTGNAIWSPDGRHVVYTRTRAGQRTEVARVRPGSTAAPEILASYPHSDAARRRVPLAWPANGDQILARSGGDRPGLFLVAPDFKSERPVRSQRLGQGPVGFSKDGREVLGIARNTTGDGAPWQLWSVDITTGRERLAADVDLSVSAQTLSGFSLHPDGTGIITSVQLWPSDIWMLEGFDRSRQ